MNIYFLTSLFPKEKIEEIKKNSIGPIANANNALQWAYVKGLVDLTDLNVIDFPSIGSYPIRYKNFFWNSSKFDIGKKEKGESLSFLNLIGVKHISKYISFKKRIAQLSLKNTEEKIIFLVYDFQIPILYALSKIKKKYKNIHISIIAPDLHGFTGYSTNFIYTAFYKIEKYFLKKSIDTIDSYILISKYMKDKLEIRNKPYLVIEGIYADTFPEKGIDFNYDTKTIFYSGALDKRNGVHNLVDAFRGISKSNYRLIICGDGELRVEIEELAKKDSRISYLGQLPRKDILFIQQQCTLLVNPRPNKEEFTKYSFPSKTMEYFASGIPTLMYKLQGVPEEYFNYCFLVSDDLSVDSLQKAMINICESEKSLLIEKGSKAREFIMQEKTHTIQCKKVLDFIKFANYNHED